MTLVFTALGSVMPAKAYDLPSPFLSGTFEMWSGGEGQRRGWSSYSGFTWAPLGKLANDGLRIRATGGYGEYSYAGFADGERQSIYGTTVFADLLFGYQMGLGRLTLKAFVGASFDGHLLQPFDDKNRVEGPASGAKGVLEAWYNVTDKTWVQADLSFAAAHRVWGARTRIGYRVFDKYMQDVSVGAELGGAGNAAGDIARLGAFARYAWYGGELSTSVGVAGDVTAAGSALGQLRNPYGSIVYLKRF